MSGRTDIEGSTFAGSMGLAAHAVRTSAARNVGVNMVLMTMTLMTFPAVAVRAVRVSLTSRRSWTHGSMAKMYADSVREVILQRAGMCLFIADTQLRKQVQDDVGFDL